MDRIVLNISGDEDFINKAVCGKTQLFKYLRLLISKLNNKNTITLDFNDNLALDFPSVDELLKGLKVSNAKGFNLKLNNTKVFKENHSLNLDS